MKVDRYVATMACEECLAELGEKCICERPCPECKGSGMVDVETIDRQGDLDYFMKQCETCDGDGKGRA